MTEIQLLLPKLELHVSAAKMLLAVEYAMLRAEQRSVLGV